MLHGAAQSVSASKDVRLASEGARLAAFTGGWSAGERFAAPNPSPMQRVEWAREAADPINIYEAELLERGTATQEELDEVKAKANKACKEAVKFATDSPAPPASLAKELEFPDAPATDYNLKQAPAVRSASA